MSQGGGSMAWSTARAGPAVRRILGAEGATWIKAYTDIHEAELGAAIKEAHKRGIKVTGHLCSVSFREAVALGIDNLEHGILTASDFESGEAAGRVSGDDDGRRTARWTPRGATADSVIGIMIKARCR